MEIWLLSYGVFHCEARTAFLCNLLLAVTFYSGLACLGLCAVMLCGKWAEFVAPLLSFKLSESSLTKNTNILKLHRNPFSTSTGEAMGLKSVGDASVSKAWLFVKRIALGGQKLVSFFSQ